MKAKQVLTDVQKNGKTGWTKITRIELLCEFLDDKGLAGDLAAFLQGKVPAPVATPK